MGIQSIKYQRVIESRSIEIEFKRPPEVQCKFDRRSIFLKKKKKIANKNWRTKNQTEEQKFNLRRHSYEKKSEKIHI